MTKKIKATRKPPAKLTPVYLFETRSLLLELAAADGVSASQMMRELIRREHKRRYAPLDTKSESQ